MSDIGWAVKTMKDDGFSVRRPSWNGKNMWIKIQYPAMNKDSMTQEFVYMKTVNGTLVPWVCSQSDLLADDWELAE